MGCRFRWVDYQVDHVCGCYPVDFESALAELVTKDAGRDIQYERERHLKRNSGGRLEIRPHRLFHFSAKWPGLPGRPLHVKEESELKTNFLLEKSWTKGQSARLPSR